MGRDIWYPTPERIIEYNLIILNIIKAKKADKAEVLNRREIIEIVEGCKNFEGDIYDKAAFLLTKLIQRHPFASGNRRTAFVISKEFILNNHGIFRIKDDPKYAKVMLGIRENFYTQAEIKEWIQHGKIRDFRR